jgi:hypothetical protein
VTEDGKVVSHLVNGEEKQAIKNWRRGPANRKAHLCYRLYLLLTLVLCLEACLLCKWVTIRHVWIYSLIVTNCWSEKMSPLVWCHFILFIYLFFHFVLVSICKIVHCTFIIRVMYWICTIWCIWTNESICKLNNNCYM